MPRPRTHHRSGFVLGIALALVLAMSASAAQAAVPGKFFGMDPQTALSQADTDRMAYGGVDVVRLPFQWSVIQPTASGGYDWSSLDPAVERITRSGMTVLPFLYSSPSWIAKRFTVMPVRTARARRAWSAFLKAAVDRYGPSGSFWQEHGPTSLSPLPKRAIRKWQLWNESNFFYFATPASPKVYARLLRISHRALTARDPRSKVILSGLFARPKPRYPRGMDATRFLNSLYAIRGTRKLFDGVALHPYAANARVLRRMTEDLRKVMVRNHDRRTGLYLTEVGWGSQARSRVSFEVGLRGQAKQLRRAYRYLIRNRRRLNVKGIYWFTWKDQAGGCSFCDSTGLFRRGTGFSPKPAWYAFVRFTGGKSGAPPTPSQGCPLPPLPC